MHREQKSAQLLGYLYVCFLESPLLRIEASFFLFHDQVVGQLIKRLDSNEQSIHIEHTHDQPFYLNSKYACMVVVKLYV